MRFIICVFSTAVVFCQFLQAPATVSDQTEEDFDLWDERTIRVERDYGAGLGGPVAAGIREKKPDKGEKGNSTSRRNKEYVPTSNVNNTKKCEVIRTRVTLDPAQARLQYSREFDKFVKKFNKKYPSKEAKERARNNFIASREGANGLNQGRCSNSDAQFDTTIYSDWSQEQFHQLAGSKEEGERAKLPPPFKVTEDQSRFLYKLPRLDWRTYGVIPPVRDQLQCGGCYAFSTTDLLASQERIDNKKFYANDVESYSAQYFIDCMPEPYGYGCKGGRPAAVLDYMASCQDCAILLDRCYQYRNKYLRCKQPSINCRNDVGTKPVFSKQVNLISNRECETMATLLRWGPVVAVVELSPAWQFYGGKGIIRDSHCGKKPDHAVLIVGYDYTGDVPYYIVRNSWSKDWGDAGYVKVEACKNTCGIAAAALVTCTDKKKCASFKGIKDFAKHPNVKPNLKPDGTLA